MTRLVLFDDGVARRWAPFSLTRPVGELMFGCMTLRERAERVFSAPCLGHVSRRALVGFDEPGSAPGLSPDQVDDSYTRVVLSSRAVLALTDFDIPPGPARIVVAGRPVGWILPPGAPLPSDLSLRDPGVDPAPDPTLVLEGRILDRPWDLVEQNAERIASDIERLWPEASDVDGAIRIGSGTVSLGEGASIEPGVVLDTTGGPIRLADGASVQGPARLVGPLFIGRDSQIFGGVITTSSIGPVCKIRGEVSDSVLTGYCNKAHDGYLGHALTGRWVNLGAMTTNSDLKNNYGNVRVWTPDGDVDTGLMKVGCFLGDHVRTGIGTVLNTGTVVGAGSNLFGGAMPPVAVPAFSWGSGAELQEYRLDKFLETAARAMARRDVELTPGVRAILERGWETTARSRSERGG